MTSSWRFYKRKNIVQYLLDIVRIMLLPKTKMFNFKFPFTHILQTSSNSFISIILLSEHFFSIAEKPFASKEMLKYKLKPPEKLICPPALSSRLLSKDNRYLAFLIQCYNYINLSKYIQSHQFLYRVLKCNHFCLSIVF